MKIVMLGAPGAGKGTQAKLLAEELSIPHISTGDIFRMNVKEGTDLGKEAKGYMDKGQLVPDSLTIRLVIDRLGKEDCAKGYILDGFPRTIPQAESLDEELNKLDDKLDFAVNVEVPDENITKRMAGRRACTSCGATYHMEFHPPKKEGVCDACQGELILRNDDKPETVEKRLAVYHEQTQPLISFYEKQGILVTADGTKQVEEVFQEILKLVGEK